MGYYFDARNPSRLETFLNSNPDLTPAERARAKALIEKIITHAITKYNFSSVGYYEHPDLPPESVLVIDQKGRSEEHTSELQSLMRISYAVFCLKKKNTHIHQY